MSWWRSDSQDRRRRKRRPLRQYWTRRPTPTDALTGYIPDGLGLIEEERPAQVYSDEIDPAWADDASEAGPQDSQVT